MMISDWASALKSSSHTGTASGIGYCSSSTGSAKQKESVETLKSSYFRFPNWTLWTYSEARLSLWADLVHTVYADDKDSQKAGPTKLIEN